MFCLTSILLVWLEAVQMQGRYVTAVENSRADSSPYISVEVLMEVKKFCIWSYSFDTLRSSRWLGMFQMAQQALCSSKTLSITNKNTWCHNLEHQNLTVLTYLLYSLNLLALELFF